MKQGRDRQAMVWILFPPSNSWLLGSSNIELVTLAEVIGEHNNKNTFIEPKARGMITTK